MNKTDLLLYTLLLPDERELFGTFPHDGSILTELETTQWQLLRDISQLRRSVELKRFELIELNTAARSA